MMKLTAYVSTVALMTTVAATAITTSAHAALFSCGPLSGNSSTVLKGQVCSQIAAGKVSGYVIYLDGGNPTDEFIAIYSCNASQTVCTEVPGSYAAALQTPKVTATPGAYYKTCTTFEVVKYTELFYYDGCSPLVND